MQPNRPDPIDVLQRLFLVVYRSLPMYLADATPYTHRGDEAAQKVLANIVADERLYSGRIAEAILQHRGRIDSGEYAMGFTGLNFVSLDYLLTELIAGQKQDIAAIEQCAADLSGDPPARALTEEVLGNARGHLESLQELVKSPTIGLQIASPQS